MACWTGRSGPAATASIEDGSRDVTGSYWCTFVEGEFDNERQPCAIKKVNGKLVLARLAGAERIRGQIALDDSDGFRFAGEIYCPFGDCEQTEIHARFKPVGRGGFRGASREPEMVLQLVPAPAGAFGGTAYGGAAYGGDPFDLDGSFGGHSYGSHRRIDIRRRHRP